MDTTKDGTILYQVVGDVPTEPDSLEDGGQAMIVELGGMIEDDDPHMFVRLQSWQDGARRNDATTHPRLRSMLGRRVRVTIEDLGPVGDPS